MSKLLFLILLLVCAIEVFKADPEIDALDEMMKQQGIDIPTETPSTEATESSPTIQVVELTEETLQSTLSSNENVFLYFYAPFCSTCKDLEIVMEEVAQKLHELKLNVALGKINSEKYPSASENFHITAYPAAFFVKKGTVITPFADDKTTENIVGFIERRVTMPLPNAKQEEPLKVTDTETTETPQSANSQTGNELPEVPRIESVSELNDLIGSYKGKHVFLYLGINLRLEITQRQVISEKALLYQSNSTEILERFGVNPEQWEIIHFKYSNKKAAYRERNLNIRNKHIRPDIVNEIISTCVNNPIVRLTDANLDRVLDTGFPTVMIIVDNFSNETVVEEFENILRTVKRQYDSSDLWYYIANYNQTNVKVFIDLLRITPDMFPTAVTFDGSQPKDNNEMRKYLFNRETLNAENLKAFLDDYYANKLPVFLASEEIPANPVNEHGIYKIVSKSFPDVVLNSTGKEILLLLCAPYLPECPKLQTRYNRVAQKLSHNEKLLVATIDPAANEIEHLVLDYLPYLMFMSDIPDKFAHHYKFEGNLTTKEMVAFATNYSKYGLDEKTLENQTEIYEQEENAPIQRKSIEETVEGEGEEGEGEGEGEDGGLGDMGGDFDMGAMLKNIMGNAEGADEMAKLANMDLSGLKGKGKDGGDSNFDLSDLMAGFGGDAQGSQEAGENAQEGSATSDSNEATTNDAGQQPTGGASEQPTGGATEQTTGGATEQPSSGVKEEF